MNTLDSVQPVEGHKEETHHVTCESLHTIKELMDALRREFVLEKWGGSICDVTVSRNGKEIIMKQEGFLPRNDSGLEDFFMEIQSEVESYNQRQPQTEKDSYSFTISEN